MCVFGFFNTCSQKPQETRESMSWVLDPRGLISVSLFSRRNRYGNISFDKCCHLTWTKILCYKKEEKSNISRLKVTLICWNKQFLLSFLLCLFKQNWMDGMNLSFILYCTVQMSRATSSFLILYFQAVRLSYPILKWSWAIVLQALLKNPGKLTEWKRQA